MTGQPPHPPPEPPGDAPDDHGWIPDDDWRPPGAENRPHPATAIGHHPDPHTTNGPGEEIPWGNTAEELLTESMQRLGELTDEVTALHQMITADRDDDAGRGPGRYHRYRYERHPPKVAAAAHAELTAWVSWAVATYHLDDVLPACWERHDGLAEELAAFYVAWCNVWSDEGSYDAGPIWHDQLYRAIDRWPTWLAGTRCTQNCAADPALDATSHQHWQQQSRAADGATWRLERTRKSSPPRPVPRKKRAAPAAGIGARPAPTPPTTGRTNP